MSSKIFESYFSSIKTAEKKIEKSTVSQIRGPLLLPIFKNSLQPEAPLERTTEQEKRELIEQHSQLNQECGEALADCASYDLVAVLGQIHAPELIVNTNPLPVRQGITTMVNALKSLKYSKPPQSLTSRLEQCSATGKEIAELQEKPEVLAAYAQKLKKSTLALNVGEAFLAMVAPKSGPHSIIFEFTRVDDHSFDICVYLKGRNRSGEFVSKVTTQNKAKTWQHPCLLFEGIPQGELYDELFQTLLEMNLNRNGDGALKAHDLLEHFFERYYPKMPQGESVANLNLMARSRGRDDGWFVADACVFRTLPRPDYKKTLFEIKLNTLRAGFQRSKGLLQLDQPESEKLRIILKAGAGRLLKDLLSFKIKNIVIDDRLIIEARATALELILEIERSERHIAHVRARQTQAFSIDEPDRSNLVTDYERDVEKQKDKIAEPDFYKQSIVSEPSCQLRVQSAAELPKLLPILLSSQIGKEKGYYNYPEGTLILSTFAIDVEYFVAQLPIPQKGGDSFWDALATDQIAQVMRDFSTMLSLYYDPIYHTPQRFTAEVIDTVCAINTILCHLSLQESQKIDSDTSHPISLAAYNMYFPSMKLINKGGCFLDTHQHASRRQAMQAYFQSEKHKGVLFDPEEVQKLDVHATTPLGAFLGAIYDRYKQEIETYLTTTNLSLEKWKDWRDHVSICELFGEEQLDQYSREKGLQRFDASRDLYPYLKEKGLDKLVAMRFLAWQMGDREGIYQHLGLNYIPQCIHAATIAHTCLYDHTYDFWRGFTFQISTRSLVPKTECSVKCSFPGGFAYLNDPIVLHSSLRTNTDYVHLLRHNDFNKRMRTASTQLRETQILENNTPSKVPFDNNQFLIACCEPSFYLRSLIEYCEHHLEWFESPSEQTLFEIMLFRTIIVEDKLYFPLDEEMGQSSFRNLIFNFIKEGLDRYFLRQPNNRPHVPAVIFFLRLVSRLTPYDTSGEIQDRFDCFDYISKMLTIQDLTAQEKGALSLYRILAMSKLKRPLTVDERATLLSDWAYHKSTPLPKKAQSPFLEKEAAAFVHHQAQFMKDCKPELLRSVIATTTRQLGMGQLNENCTISSRPGYPHLITARHGDMFWELNLLTGRVRTESGIVEREKKPDWLCIFSHQSSDFLCSGSTCYFQHPQFGAMRAYYQGEREPPTIQRNVNGEWYQYIEAGAFSSLPGVLMDGYTHWLPIDTEKNQLLITDHKTGETAAIVTDGHIQMVDGTRVWHYPDKQHVLSLIESNSNYICFSENEKNEKRVLLPRYLSQNSQPLSFKIENGQLIYSANQKYALAREHKKGLLGIDNYLLLHPVDKNETTQRLLVPFCFASNYRSLSSKQSLKLVQWGSCTYFEYEVKQGKVSAHTQEGTLFLAYLYFIERRYTDAIALMRSQSPHERLSADSVRILNEIIKLVELPVSPVSYEKIQPLEQESSPEAAAVAVHAYWLYTKSRERAELSKHPLPEMTAIKKATQKYLRYQHRLNNEIRLDEEQLRDLKLNSTTPHPMSMKGYTNKGFIPFLALQDPKKEELKLPQPQVSLKDTSSKNEWKLSQNKYYIGQQTAFLPYPQEFPLIPCFETPCLLTTDWSSSFGNFEKSFFYGAYHIIKTGTDEQWEKLKFRLSVAHKKVRDTDAFRYLKYALSDPKKAPPLPQDLASLQERWDFICQLDALHTNLKPGASHLEKFSLPIHDPVPTIATPILPAKQALPAKKEGVLTLAHFSQKALDGGFSKSLFAHCFKADPSKQKQQVRFGLPPLELTDDEKTYEGAIHATLEAFKKDYEKGIEINAQTLIYSLENEKDLSEALDGKIGDLDAELLDLETSLLELANQTDPHDPIKKLGVEMGLHSEISLLELSDLFLQGNIKKFAGKNPYLLNRHFIERFATRFEPPLEPHDHLAIDYLYNLMGLYMAKHVYRTKLARIKKRCSEIADAGLNTLKGEAKIQLIADELKPHDEDIYNIWQHPELLVFEYLSMLSLRPDQAKLLKKMLTTGDLAGYSNYVFQMIMGGGKTAIMAVVLLKMAAKEGKLSLFITPSSQYGSVRYNLRKALFDCFGQEMEEIDATRDELNLMLCKDILNRLETTIKKGNFLLVKAETLQALELEFLDLIFKVSETDEEPTAELLERINTLKSILLIFRKQGHALIDEVDLVLNAMQEVNFPSGKEERVAAERVLLIRSMFEVFTNDKAQFKDNGQDYEINVKELVGLHRNEQRYLSKTDLNGPVAQAVAYHLATTQKSLFLDGYPDFFMSFYRYISGNMNVATQKLIDHPDGSDELHLTDQDRTDLEFLRHLKNLREAKDPQSQEAAHQIALVKHMMLNILPLTFSKTGKRHYGRGGAKPGEVRFYHAVDTPSDNLFGHHWEAVAYHFLTALQIGISEEQIRANARILRADAEAQSAKEKIPFDQTFAATEFLAMTKVGLHEMDQPEKMQKAIVNLNQNLEALLKFEAQTVIDLITYFPYRLTSTGQSLLGMLLAKIAMSGTPWNIDCYEDSLTDNFDPALGTEGRIADVVLSRIATRGQKDYVHFTDENDFKADRIHIALEKLFNTHPEKESIQLLMDTGALCKDVDNLVVAKILAKITQKDVLFFARDKNRSEKTPDTLFVWKHQSGSVEKVGGRDDLASVGLTEGSYVVFLDERHTTGIDLPFLEDAVGLMTLDDEMLSRTFFQSLLRFRSFFLNQRIEFVIPERLKKSFTHANHPDPQVNIILSALLVSIKNQAIIKSKHYYRACKHKIDNAFRQNLLSSDGLLCEGNLTADSMRSIFKTYQSVTLNNQADAPYDQFGHIIYDIDSLEALKSYRKQKLNLFKKSNPPAAALQEVKRLTGIVIDRAKNSPFRPKTVFEAGAHDTESEVNVLAEVTAQIQTQQEQELSVETLQELSGYRSIAPGTLVPEKQWSELEITELCHSLQKGEAIEMKYLSDLFQKAHFPYKNDFTAVFGKRIYATNSWIHTTDRTLPVFHRMQRRLQNLLIVRTQEGFQAVALSYNEAGQFKQFLKQAYQKDDAFKDVWLIQPSSLLEDNPHEPFPSNHGDIQKILLETYVFNGAIDDIHTIEEIACDWLFENHGENYQAKTQFLQLKIADDPVQKRRFFTSDIFGDPAVIARKLVARSGRIADRLKGFKKEDIQRLQQGDRLIYMFTDLVNWLTPTQIPWLLPHQIPYLKEPELIRAVPEKYTPKLSRGQLVHISDSQIKWLEESPIKTQELPASKCPFMSDKQLTYLSPKQVGGVEDPTQLERLYNSVPTKLAHISAMQVQKGLVQEKFVPEMRNKEAIAALPVEWLHQVNKIHRQKYLCKAQVAQFDPEAHKQLILELSEQQMGWLKAQEPIPTITQIPQILPIQTPDLVPSPETIDELPEPTLNTLPPGKIKELDESTAQSNPTCLKVIKTAAIILAALIGLGAALTGCFALIGAYASFAPQFTINLYRALQHVELAYALTAGGGILLLGLVSYAIHQTCHPTHKLRVCTNQP